MHLIIMYPLLYSSINCRQDNVDFYSASC